MYEEMKYQYERQKKGNQHWVRTIQANNDIINKLRQENQELQEGINTIADTLDIGFTKDCDVDTINGVLESKLEEYDETQEELEQMKKQITSLKKALEYTKKNKVNEDDDPFLPESHDVGGLDTF